jgi:hypothetical protein
VRMWRPPSDEVSPPPLHSREAFFMDHFAHCIHGRLSASGIWTSLPASLTVLRCHCLRWCLGHYFLRGIPPSGWE